MMSAYIFSGPTLPFYTLKEHLGLSLNSNQELLLPAGGTIKFLPPVSEGDILYLVPDKPKIIGIIDGYFENMPAVWHKEILFAMSNGIHVMGAASLGALRATELSAFGMEGVGAVFQAFSDGLLEDDDEVSVIHGPKEQGFPLLSEAMVNIRATLEAAQAQKILSASEHAAFLAAAKQLHYKSRSYHALLSLAHEQGLNKQVIKNLEDWLPSGRKDQKLSDALDLVKMIIEKLAQPLAPKQVLYNFEDTLPWQRARTKKL